MTEEPKDSFPVLIAENDPVSRWLLEKSLTKAGHKVVSAQNGREALDMFHKTFFPMVITDWMMPQMDGLQLCRAIRDHVSPGYVFIVLITAKDSKGDIIAALEAGADDCLTKPFKHAELMARLKTGKRVLALERSLKNANEEIKVLSITDHLTNSFNRGYVMSSLPGEISRARRYGHPLSLIMCDIDRFKKVNDSYGHLAGDSVLKEFVDRLKEAIRDGIDWVARYGGEEFLIVLPETGREKAWVAAERLRHKVAESVIRTGEDDITLTASFGIASFDPSTDKETSVEVLIKEADEYLYQAKNEGRNRVRGREKRVGIDTPSEPKSVEQMKKKKVLAVDNHPVILKFMTQLLVKNGHHVLTAQDGISALEILKTYVPDVAFIDLVMPNISGDKLCQIIRGMPKLKDVYLVILSATAAEQTVNFAEFGANACIAKGPFDEMARHVLAVLDQTEPETPGGLPEKIIGLEHVYSRQITKELLSVKRHLEMILMSMAEGILELNRDSSIIYANPSALSIIDTSEERLLGSYFPELFQEDNREKVKKLLEAPGIASLEIREDAPSLLNGKEISLNILPVKDDENKTIIVLNDITKQKRVKAQIQRAQKMEAIGTLAGGMAHDFNNLLMAILGNASLMLLDIGPAHPYYARLKSIEKQVESGAKLTAQLLGYASKGTYEIKPIDLNRLVEETSETFGRTKKEITIQRELADDIFAIEADEGQIEQVLLNLYVNAADAMSTCADGAAGRPGGGRLTLKTRNARDEDIKGKLYKPKPGNYVQLTVTDTGTGMDKKTQERIFDPFFTTKEIGRGTGLGLASAYGIIKGHGGYIDVDSKKVGGTTFKIFLPASEKAFSQAAKTAIKIVKGDETILLVDDETMILDVGQQLLKTMGYDVLIATDGKQAVEIYRGNKNKIDLVILDMIMPEIDAGKVFDLMREINPHVKVLLSSGYSIEGQATEILERDCNGFIQKPFNIVELSQSIRGILKK